MPQNFGSEARGGACRAQLVPSDSFILYPYVNTIRQSGCNVVKGLCALAPELNDGSILILEEGLVRADLSVFGNKTIQVYSIPATCIAEVPGKCMALNSVMVGFFAAVTHLLDSEGVGKAVADSVPASFRELNLKAFGKGLVDGITALTDTANPADADLQVEYSPQ